jgi:hypothetical protein
MVYMADSERASRLGLPLEIGLHLNLTAPFTAPNAPTVLTDHQRRLANYLLSHRLAQVVYNPLLTQSFDFVVKAQLDEFRRLYGNAPRKIDGHHHLHLSTNVLLQRLLPKGGLVRRSFHFEAGQKGQLNRAYRGLVDWMLARRHLLADFFFALPPAEDCAGLRRIRELADRFVVEVEVHPVEQNEHDSLQILNNTGSLEGVLVATPAEARAWVRGAYHLDQARRRG